MSSNYTSELKAILVPDFSDEARFDPILGFAGLTQAGQNGREECTSANDAVQSDTRDGVLADERCAFPTDLQFGRLSSDEKTCQGSGSYD